MTDGGSSKMTSLKVNSGCMFLQVFQKKDSADKSTESSLSTGFL